MEATASQKAKVIKQTHTWGDCTKYGDHCHCAIRIQALTAGEVRTCSRCGIKEHE